MTKTQAPPRATPPTRPAPGLFAALAEAEIAVLTGRLLSALAKFRANGLLAPLIEAAAAASDLEKEITTRAMARKRAVPYSLTPKALAYLDKQDD